MNKKKNAAAHTVSDNYHDESYFENEEGFGKGYSKQVKVSERAQDGVQDESFLKSIRKMVTNMKEGALEFETSMQRGMPVQLPNVFKKIKKCVSADPFIKLCFTVNPDKKYVKVDVRVPGFKKALRRADLTQFQQRMFGTKVGNALHDIARKIKIPSVNDIFAEMDKNDKLNERRAK